MSYFKIQGVSCDAYSEPPARNEQRTIDDTSKTYDLFLELL